MNQTLPVPGPANSLRAAQRLAPAALAGLAGGVIGFVLSQLAPDATSEASLKPLTGVWFALIIVGIGGAIIAGSHVADKRQPTTETVIIAAVALLVGGFISGYLAQGLFASLLDDSAAADCNGDAACLASEVRVARMLGWALAGGLGGAGVGLSFRSWRRVQNGMIGGAIGGLLGGLLFDLIPLVLDTESVGVPQFIAISLIGVFMAVLIGLIDTARTTMWLEVLSGELRGRQYLVIDNGTTLGSARTAQIRLVGDRQVAEIHLEVTPMPPSFSCRTVTPVMVNGVTSTAGPLAHGDVLLIGGTQLAIGLRRANPTGATPPIMTTHAATAAPSVAHTGSSPYGTRPTASQASHGAMSVDPARPPSSASAPLTPPSPAPPSSSGARPRLPTKPQQ